MSKTQFIKTPSIVNWNDFQFVSNEFITCHTQNFKKCLPLNLKTKAQLIIHVPENFNSSIALRLHIHAYQSVGRLPIDLFTAPFEANDESKSIIRLFNITFKVKTSRNY
ncbi:hypothetical protein ACKWTF_011619 [Chironomus riparius]